MSARASCFIHIGTHKTGSTSIQTYLVRNEAVLAKSGIIYPRIGRSTHPGHVNLFREAAGSQQFSAEDGGWRDILELADRSPGKKLVVSAEGLSTLDRSGLERLTESVGRLEPTVIVYLRAQEQLAPSVYAQRCKDGRGAEGFSQFLGHDLETVRYRYAEILKPWAEAFGYDRVLVRPLEFSQLKGGSIYTDFIVALGESEEFVDRLEGVPSMNRSPSPAALEVMRRIASLQREAGTFEQRRFARTAGRLVALAAVEFDDAGGPLMSGHTAVEVRERFADENAWVARELLGRPDGVLFQQLPDPTVEASPEPPLLEVDYIIALLEQVARHASQPG